MEGRQKVAAVLGEFLGTYVLATAMLAMLVRTNFEFFSAIAAAVVYGLGILVLGDISGSHLNPVVTLGHWTTRKITTMHAAVFIVAQLLAGLAAWRLGQYFLNQTLSKTASGGFNWRVLIAEAVGTLVFTFAVAAATAKKLDNTKKAAVCGAALFAGIVIASLASNGLLNPSVDIAIRSVSWAYILGPIVGAIVGMNLYTYVFADTKPKAKK
jgi:glycerol uptake facilitator-like aquaporin